MKSYSQTHLSDEVLRREIQSDNAREHEITAMLLARLAEYNARKLFLPDGFPSMLAYCTRGLHLSEDAAKKRLQVARVGRECPAVFAALAEGRVHLSGLRLLAPHVTPETVDELLAAATHQTIEEIERMLAAKFPRQALAARVETIESMPPTLTAAEGATWHPEGTANLGLADCAHAPTHACAHVTPLSPDAYAVQFTRSEESDKRFRYLQDLLGHAAPRGDIAEVYDRAVKALIAKLEHVRFGACERPRSRPGRTKAGSRHIPAHVKRAVWQRDGGQCTFVAESGRRCEARGDVEFDHVTEVARGGEATVEGLRLRCRGHNQHTAERTFGAGFMRRKRDEARAAAARRRAEKAAEAERSRLLPHQLEVTPWLRALGCREQEAREAAALCRDMVDAPLEDRVRRALSLFGGRCGRRVAPGSPGASFVPGVAPTS